MTPFSVLFSPSRFWLWWFLLFQFVPLFSSVFFVFLGSYQWIVTPTLSLSECTSTYFDLITHPFVWYKFLREEYRLRRFPLLRFSLDCTAHSLSSSNKSGPVNQSPFSILFKSAPLPPWSARFILVGQYFLSMLTSLLISAIVRTLLDTKTFHGIPGFVIQFVVDLMGHPRKALHRFFVMFAAIWLPTSCNLGIKVFLFNFSGLWCQTTLNDSWRVYHRGNSHRTAGEDNWSAKTWMCTAFILLTFL